MRNIEIIAQKLATLWHKLYVVGSYNVHTILKRNTGSDIDLTTSAKPDEIRKVLKVVGEIWAKYGTLIVREWWVTYEITTFRKDIWSINQRKPKTVIYSESLIEDAHRRDFTFNAIYYDPIKKEYIDPVGWIEDMKKWMIRFVWDINRRLDEDILRLLRYVRLKNKYWFNPAESSYENIITERIPELRNISKERIKQELDKMLLDKTNITALEDLKGYWFFREFLPFVDNLSHTPGWKTMHQEGNVWKHTILSLYHLNTLKCHDVDIYWATLLHDIGKYSTYTYDEQGNIHYYGHEDVGSQVFTDSIVDTLPFSTKSQKKIQWLIKNHIRVGNIEFMKKLKQYELMMHPYFADLITLYTVDNLGKIPPDKECSLRLIAMYNRFQEKIKTVQFLTWNDIMRMYPDLVWKAIGIQLKLENKKILSSIEI